MIAVCVGQCADALKFTEKSKKRRYSHTHCQSSTAKATEKKLVARFSVRCLCMSYVMLSQYFFFFVEIPLNKNGRIVIRSAAGQTSWEAMVVHQWCQGRVNWQRRTASPLFEMHRDTVWLCCRQIEWEAMTSTAIIWVRHAIKLAATADRRLVMSVQVIGDRSGRQLFI